MPSKNVDELCEQLGHESVLRGRILPLLLGMIGMIAVSAGGPLMFVGQPTAWQIACGYLAMVVGIGV